MEGNASVYQVNTVSRITGEGGAEFLRTSEGGGRGGEKIMSHRCRGFATRVALGLGDSSGGGERGGDEGRRRGVLQQRHGWLEIDNGVISSAWKCLLFWQISILGEAFEHDLG